MDIEKSISDKNAFDLLINPISEDGVFEDGELAGFQDFILDFYLQYGRSFPWRDSFDPYEILLSELMLQQTQTDRVLPKYIQFLSNWPCLQDMADAPLANILQEWKGLGYNRRAIALKRIAQICVEKYGSKLPIYDCELRTLPMVGPATAAAVRAFAYCEKALYLETNIRRVLLYVFFHNKEGVHDKELYSVLERLIQGVDPKHWYYALMDYGVFLKKNIPNPNRRSAHYSKQSKFENSNRQIRGQLLTVFTERGTLTRQELYNRLDFSEERIVFCLDSLIQEGFITCIDTLNNQDEKKVDSHQISNSEKNLLQKFKISE